MYFEWLLTPVCTSTTTIPTQKLIHYLRTFLLLPLNTQPLPTTPGPLSPPTCALCLVGPECHITVRNPSRTIILWRSIHVVAFFNSFLLLLESIPFTCEWSLGATWTELLYTLMYRLLFAHQFSFLSNNYQGVGLPGNMIHVYFTV